jgi:hypothetical protein
VCSTNITASDSEQYHIAAQYITKQGVYIVKQFSLFTSRPQAANIRRYLSPHNQKQRMNNTAAQSRSCTIHSFIFIYLSTEKAPPAGETPVPARRRITVTCHLSTVN